MKPKVFSSSYFQILFSFLFSWALMCCLYPELLIKHSLSLVLHPDRQFYYTGVFTLISNFFHGGIQLWNSYDQMPLAYYHLTGGLYTFSNILTAFFYILFSPLFKIPGEAYHAFFSSTFFVIALFSRTVGIFLLLKRFAFNTPVLIATTIYTSSMLCPQFFIGLNCTDLYSFFPLLIHFILKYFEHFRFKDLCLAFLVMMICVTYDPLVALGYFYQGIHFFILSTLIWCFVFHILPKLRRKDGVRLEIDFTRIKIPYRKIILVILLTAVILGPQIYSLKSTYHEYDLDHEKSRMTNIFSISAYFDRPGSFAGQKQFFPQMLNFAENKWEYSWLFTGYLCLFLVLIGLFCYKDNRKYIFLMTVCLFFLINSPRNSVNLPGMIHWINALTNPFKFLPRSFHMTGAFLLIFILSPLIGMGMQALSDFFKKRGKLERKKAFFLGLYLTALFFICIDGVPDKVKVLMGMSFIMSLIIIGALLFESMTKILRWGLYALLAVILLIDLYGMRQYLKPTADNFAIEPQIIKGFDDYGYLSFEYQNPAVRPFRHYFNVRKIGGEAYNYIAHYPLYNGGQFYQFTHMQKYFIPATNYTPRHISYSRIAQNVDYMLYLDRNQKHLFFADTAMMASPGLMRLFVTGNLTDKVIMINERPQEEATFSEGIPQLDAKSRQALNTAAITYHLSKAKKREGTHLNFYSFPLPQNMMPFLTSTPFTTDSLLLRVFMKEGELSPGFGRLVMPFSYDAGHIEEGKLTIALPARMKNLNRSVKFHYAVKGSVEGIADISINEADTLGLTYKTPKDGWLVFHTPYDPKWQLTVNEKKRKIYRVNGSFFGFPLKKGKHHILLQYWPQTKLRALIGLSVFFSIITMLILMNYGIREYSKEY